MRLRTLFLQLTFLICSSFVGSAQKAEPVAVQVYFSPKDQIAQKLIALIEKEQKSIHVAIYCLTHRGIAEALIQAKKRGVEVEMIVDPFSVKTRFPLGRIARSGIPVFVWDPGVTGQRKKAPLMHDKFCIFGAKGVWSGSFNFTYDADQANRENALFFVDDEAAKRYLEQFRSMKYKGCRPYEEYLTAHNKSSEKVKKRK